MEFENRVGEFDFYIYETKSKDTLAIYHGYFNASSSYKFVDGINKMFLRNAELLFEEMMTNFTIADEYNYKIGKKIAEYHFDQSVDVSSLIDPYDLYTEIDISSDFHLIASFSCNLAEIYFAIDWDSLEIENAIFFLDLFNVMFKYCVQNEMCLFEEDYHKKEETKTHLYY